MADFTSYEIRRAGTWIKAFDRCIMNYDARFLRRKILKTEKNFQLLGDLKHTTSLNDKDAFIIDDGRIIEVIAAKEPLFSVTGDLVQLAWHIGNRHTPCQIEAKRLVIQRDLVIGHMLEHLGAQINEILEPFTPEGGAYGHGRTHSHEHGATAHDH